jgi:hypothetical protein
VNLPTGEMEEGLNTVTVTKIKITHNKNLVPGQVFGIRTKLYKLWEI